MQNISGYINRVKLRVCLRTLRWFQITTSFEKVGETPEIQFKYVKRHERRHFPSSISQSIYDVNWNLNGEF